MLLPIAHAGHWALYGLYLVPVLIVLASILTTVVRDRRSRRGGSPPPDG